MTDAPTPSPEPRPLRPRSLGHYLLYVASLPERSFRSIAGFAGMAALMVARLLPGPIRETRLYRLAILRQIRILTDQIGGAERFPGAPALDFKTAARLGLGGAIDNLFLLTLHASPLWILLAARDAAHGARQLVSEVVDELKTEGLIEPGSRLDNVDLLLGAIARLSERASDTVDCPPLSVTDLEQTLSGIQEEIANTGATALNDVAQLDRLAESVRALSRTSGQGLIEVLTGLAAQTAVKSGRFVVGTGAAAVASVKVLSRHLYRDILLDYEELIAGFFARGLFGSLHDALAPHMIATQRNFARELVTVTELGLSFGRLAHAPWRLSQGPRSLA